MQPTPSAIQAPRLRKNPFLALQHRDYRLLWFGQLISIAGSQMQTVAINWHIWQLTQSPEAGIAAALFGAPWSVVIGGAATLILVALTGAMVPALRNYRD